MMIKILGFLSLFFLVDGKLMYGQLNQDNCRFYKIALDYLVDNGEIKKGESFRISQITYSDLDSSGIDTATEIISFDCLKTLEGEFVSESLDSIAFSQIRGNKFSVKSVLFKSPFEQQTTHYNFEINQDSAVRMLSSNRRTLLHEFPKY